MSLTLFFTFLVTTSKRHNMDRTETFMHESTEFFINENLPRFVRGEELLNPVDREAGY